MALSVKQALSEERMGAELLTVELADPGQVVRTFAPVRLLVTPTGEAVSLGLCPPILFEIFPPSGVRRATSRVVGTTFPGLLTFTPNEGGTHLLVVREKFHNRWYGSLTLEIAGAVLG